MKKFKLKVLAASVLAGFVGVSGTAQADSVLAPLVMSDILNGWTTTITLKARGNGNPNSRFSGGDITDLHYAYRRKATSLGGMFAPLPACEHTDGAGRVSSWDMLTHTVDPFIDFLAKTPLSDQSTPFTPPGVLAGQNFYGYTVISDVANLNSATEEGNLSGDVAVYNLIAGVMLDYKLLNNHRSNAFGDFGKGFTSKTATDLQWNPVNRDITFWLGVATGTDMVNGNYGAVISQNQLANGSDDPKVPHNLAPNVAGGAYDNDETNYSGDNPYAFNCMSFFTRNQVLNAGALPTTVNGGWVRKSILGTGGATGAMIYKAALKVIPTILAGRLQISFTSETSGHLNRGFDGKTHINRPY